MVTELQYRLLKWISPGEPGVCSGEFFTGKSKVAILLGHELLTRVKDKTVIDFGCGEGLEAIDLARHGAKKVIGVDNRPELVERARAHGAASGLDGRCEFVVATEEKADLIVSIDAFEHFEEPAEILRIMDKLLQPGGEVIASFGPTWYHPLGGHLFSLFPWAHLIFSEDALIRWRSDFKTDGARRFGEVAGGLNQMTIRRFLKLVEASPFELAMFEAVPIQKLRSLHGRFTREFTTAVVRCRLVRKPSPS